MEAMLPLHTLMHTSLLASMPALFGVAGFHARKSRRASAPALFGVAGFHARKSPAGLRARPIGHWQHWNWQHFHIGNIFHPPKNFFARPLAPYAEMC